MKKATYDYRAQDKVTGEEYIVTVRAYDIIEAVAKVKAKLAKRLDKHNSEET